jgi:hypothetical protein
MLGFAAQPTVYRNLNDNLEEGRKTASGRARALPLAQRTSAYSHQTDIRRNVMWSPNAPGKQTRRIKSTLSHALSLNQCKSIKGIPQSKTA